MERLRIGEYEEYLRNVSDSVDFDKDDIESIIRSLREYCNASAVYALAPIQIGIPKRVIYIKNSKEDMSNNTCENYNEEIIYINPIITASRGKTRFLEGCYSCSVLKDGEDVYYVGEVFRPYEIDITYFDQNGTSHEKTISGFEVVVFSHEYDHLNGILHMDRTDKIMKMNARQMKEYRANNPYQIISKIGSFNYDEK